MAVGNGSSLEYWIKLISVKEGEKRGRGNAVGGALSLQGWLIQIRDGLVSKVC